MFICVIQIDLLGIDRYLEYWWRYIYKMMDKESGKESVHGMFKPWIELDNVNTSEPPYSALKVNNRNTANNVVLVPLLLNLTSFINSSGAFIANFEQVIFIADFDACWDDNDNNNDYKSHDDVDRTDLMIDLI